MEEYREIGFNKAKLETRAPVIRWGILNKHKQCYKL